MDVEQHKHLECQNAAREKKPLPAGRAPCYKRPSLSQEGGWKTSALFMSQHRSLRAVATIGGKRNVLKRFERVSLLKKRGQWKDGDRITGLRKTKPEA